MIFQGECQWFTVYYELSDLSSGSKLLLFLFFPGTPTWDTEGEGRPRCGPHSISPEKKQVDLKSPRLCPIRAKELLQRLFKKLARLISLMLKFVKAELSTHVDQVREVGFIAGLPDFCTTKYTKWP
jgi:hypothetical protein